MNTKISNSLRSEFPILEQQFDIVDSMLQELWDIVEAVLILPKHFILEPDGMARKLARGYLLRSFDLSNGVVACVNSGSIQAAFVLVRGLYESFAAMHHANSAFERTRTTGSKDELLGEIVPRIAFGNRYMKSQGHTIFPESVNVMTSIKKADKFLSRLLSDQAGEPIDSGFLTNYEFLSEFVHPTQGSLTFYESSVSNAWRYAYAPRERDISFICGQLKMLTGGLLFVHKSLSSFFWEE